jgi:hypothetical protein
VRLGERKSGRKRGRGIRGKVILQIGTRFKTQSRRKEKNMHTKREISDSKENNQLREKKKEGDGGEKR